MDNKDVDRIFLEGRLRAISIGLKEGVRREIRRLAELRLPIYVADNGQVIDRKIGPSEERDEQP